VPRESRVSRRSTYAHPGERGKEYVHSTMMLERQRPPSKRNGCLNVPNAEA
jgi:hypothetical protein